MRLIRLFKQELAKEIKEWIEKDLISSDQGQSIGELYDIDLVPNKSQSLGYKVLVALGYLFIGIAFILLIGANWDEMPRFVRMSGLVVLTLGIQLYAIRRFFLGELSKAKGLFFLGGLLYGASIILIAQIYHLGEHMPDGVFWWALGTLPFGVLLKDGWLTLFSLLLALIWFFLEVSMNRYPVLFPLFIAVGCYVLATAKQNALLFLVTLGSIGFWAEVSLSALWLDSTGQFDVVPEHLFSSIALFVLAYAVSKWLMQSHKPFVIDYGVMLSLWVLRFFLIGLLIFSFYEPWRELLSADWLHLEGMWLIVLALLMLALGVAARANTLNKLILPVVVSLLLMLAVVRLGSSLPAVYLQVATNIVLIVTGIYLIIKGVSESLSHYFFLGVMTILVTALMRYIDLIGNYIGGAVLFIVLAAVLLMAGKFWRQSIEGGAQ